MSLIFRDTNARDYNRDHKSLKIVSHDKRVRKRFFSTNIDCSCRRRNNFADRFEKFSQIGFFDYFFRYNTRVVFVATATNFVADRMIVDFDIGYCNRRQVANDIITNF